MQDKEKYYLISHLVQFTGLTDRTIRSYISSGILQGEKINGLWHFTAEQVEHFISHPAVRPSIVAKNNGMVYDFLIDTKKAAREICVIMDIPDADKENVSEFFCGRINDGDYRKIRFSYDGAGDMARVFLKGDSAEVMRLINEYNQE